MANRFYGYGNTFGSQDIEQLFPVTDPIKAVSNANQIQEFGWNMPSLELGIKGVSSLGQMWAAFKGLSQAKKEFEFNKRITEKNLANNTKSYNNALEDRIRARQSADGRMTDADVNKYIALNQLSN